MTLPNDLSKFETKSDSVLSPKDSIAIIPKNDSIKKKPLLEGIVNRKAKDYEKIDQKKKQVTLYNQAELYYTDIELKAGIIVFDYDKIVGEFDDYKKDMEFYKNMKKREEERKQELKDKVNYKKTYKKSY